VWPLLLEEARELGAIAREYGRLGAKLVLASRSLDHLEPAAQELVAKGTFLKGLDTYRISPTGYPLDVKKLRCYVSSKAFSIYLARLLGLTWVR
jgi:hypothetical protein